jgi:peptidoglycan/LPS O-acetylase OafA/YrhL
MNKRHYPYLDGMRGLAALYVALHHAFLQSWSSVALLAGLHAQLAFRPLFFLSYGHYAVTVFIAISGFSLALSPVRKNSGNPGDTSKFFYRRARRILPPYYAAIVLASLLALTMHHPDLTLYSGSLPVTKADLITHFLLIHNLSAQHYTKIAGPFWSIAVECQIYLFFPIILAVLRRWGRRWSIALCLVLAAASLYLSGVSHGVLSHSTPPGIYFAVFGIGVYFADYVKTPRNWFGPASLAAGLATIGILFFHLENGRVGKIAADVLLGIAASTFMAYCLSKPQAKAAAILSHPLLALLGTFSYSLYLIHFPLLQMFWEQAIFPMHVSRAVGFFLVATVGMLTVLILSYAFYWVFERPFTSTSTPKKQLLVSPVEVPQVG